MRRGTRPLRRSVTNVALRREILVFSEGERTEEDYLLFWSRRHRDVLVHLDDFRGPPRQLIDRAVSTKKRSEKEARRGRGRAYDEVWCIFDVDDHPDIHEVRTIARDHGVQLAITNPCLELWFVLHFEPRTAYTDRKAAQRASLVLLGCGKALTDQALARLEARHSIARTHAKTLDEKHSGDGSPAGSNPSSGVWALVDQIRETVDGRTDGD